MKFQIKSRYDSAVLFELECESLKLCVEAAIKAGANLSGANLLRANLSGAETQNTQWPSPPMLLLAFWGEVSDELCLDLMRYDAANHPKPEKFLKWAEGAGCPYDGIKVARSAMFVEKAELITPDFLNRPVKSAYELMQALLREKCKT